MSDITTTRIFTDGEKGITAPKMNDIIGSSTIQPAFISSKPVASSADPADTMLLLKAAGTYAQVPVSTLVTSIGNQLPSSDAEIWSVRLRSFNAVGNPNFEVDQRMSGGSNIASGTFGLDRWQTTKVASTLSMYSAPSALAAKIPGTSYRITNKLLSLQLLAQQASMGTGDLWMVLQITEGPQFRELSDDVHSLSLMVNSTVAGLKFAVSIRDPGSTTKSLVKLCTVATANTWTTITLPNLPIFPAGNFSASPGSSGYMLGICLACGPTFTAPAADTWQNGNFVGAPGMSNFGAQAVNSQLLVAMVQHEPGPVCSQFMDKPFVQNLDECLRYYQKGLSYGTLFPTASAMQIGTIAYSAPGARSSVQFPKRMAKSPVIRTCGATNATLGQVYLDATNAVATVNSYSVQDTGIVGFTLSAAAPASGSPAILGAWEADTAW